MTLISRTYPLPWRSIVSCVHEEQHPQSARTKSVAILTCIDGIHGFKHYRSLFGSLPRFIPNALKLEDTNNIWLFCLHTIHCADWKPPYFESKDEMKARHGLQLLTWVTFDSLEKASWPQLLQGFDRSMIFLRPMQGEWAGTGHCHCQDLYSWSSGGPDKCAASWLRSHWHTAFLIFLWGSSRTTNSFRLSTDSLQKCCIVAAVANGVQMDSPFWVTPLNLEWLLQCCSPTFLS